MSHLKAGLLFLLLLCLSSCGRQVVEFGAADEGASRPTIIAMKPLNEATGVALDATVTATFSEGMDAESIDTTTFVLTQGGKNIPGSVTLNAIRNIASFAADADLMPGLAYTATVTNGARARSGLSLADDNVWSFATQDDTTVTAPTVIATTPLDEAMDVSSGTALSATFSAAMDATTITARTFTLKQAGEAVAGTVTLDAADTASFTPTAPLGAGLAYTATITTGAEDENGVALAADYVWTFTTTALPGEPPTVVSTLPADDATGVALNAAISATFSQPMDPASLNATTFIVKQGATEVIGTVTFAAATRTATFAPTLTMSGDLVYTATISNAVTDVDGIALVNDYSWSFTTAEEPVPPTVIATSPVNLAINVPINSKVTATFSTAMDPATLTTTTFTVKQGLTTVPGAVSLDAATNTATFTPMAPLALGLVHTATITTDAEDLGGTALAANFTWSFTSVPASVPPMVTATGPTNLAINVPINSKVTATFNTAMDPATLTTTTFTVTQGVTAVAGAVSLNAATNTATFTPTAPLVGGLAYTATITTGAKDLGGTALAANVTWTFSTVLAAPTVTATSPANLALNVPINSKVTATFSQPMDAATLTTTTFKVNQGLTPVLGTVTLDAATNTATFTPTAPLTLGLAYTSTITTGAEDVAGTPLAADFTWTFSTAPAVAAPVVLSTTPINLATNVSVNTKPTVTFSRAMDPATITNLTFTVKQGLVNVTGVVTLNALTNTATFEPLAPLGVGLTYTGTVTTGAKDLGGTPIAAKFTWTFTTGACSPASVVLGAASGFAVLAGSTVTNAGLTKIIGDMGVSPGTAITGFLPGVIVGNIHAGDPIAAQGIAALTIAYNDAAGRTLCPVTVAGNLGGQKLTPGLYKSTSSLAVSSGDLTLDAQGDGEATFIFQTATTLTTTSDRKVILTNGAKAANIFWQVGTSATLGTTSLFQGTIMADQSITLETGATLNGRALARIAAVSLAANSVVKPLP